MLLKAKEVYRAWHSNLLNLKKDDRLTLGVKIDDIFLALLELIFRACFAYDKFEKLSLVSQAIAKNDLLKFFLQISWEQKLINQIKYSNFIVDLDQIGRMLYGWKKSLAEKTPSAR